MAAIDKTYTDSYSDYKEFKRWANAQYLTFFDGYKVRIGDYVWTRKKSDFNDGEVSIMNTPTWLDIYLIQNCQVKFVLDRMKEVYGEEDFESFKSIDLTASPPEDFKQNREVTIYETDTTQFPLHQKCYKKGFKWWLQSEDNLYSYNTKTKIWVSKVFFYPTNTNTAHFSTINQILKHLKKQYLPEGAVFSISGRYVGEDYLIKTN